MAATVLMERGDSKSVDIMLLQPFRLRCYRGWLIGTMSQFTILQPFRLLS